MFDDRKITICITSYNRWNMLQQTIDSFLSMNTCPVERIVVIEDSTNIQMGTNILNKYGNKIDLIFNGKRTGQAPSIDKMYRTVTTKYILHSEDDYLFDGNGSFIEQSIQILEERQDINQIWLRHWDDYAKNQGYEQFEQDKLQTSKGVPYKMLKQNYDSWCGFSWNPAVKRTQDYHNMFTEGYGKFMTPHALDPVKPSGVQTEAACNNHARLQGYRGALLLNGACYNKGLTCPTYP